MDRSARLFVCLRCRAQVVLCSHCDHGQVYCDSACSFAARREHRRHSARRYQGSRRGRLKHAARTACWRRRRRVLCLANAEARAHATDVNKVTHQGCLPLLADASLAACETPTSSQPIEPVERPASAVEVAPPVTMPVTKAVAWLALRCRQCGCTVRPHLRQDRLRDRGVAAGGRHDHCP